jgi:hypothetical protein
MSYRWNHTDIPQKGWTLVDVEDIREDGQTEDDTPYEECMMCGNNKIRYVHIVSHPEIDQDFRVGCNCAERMTNDYVNPQKREKELRIKNNRRINWIKKQWKVSKNGNRFLNYEEHFLLIFQDKKNQKYKVKIDETYGRKSFDNFTQAKIAAFNGIEYLKEHGKW